MSHDEAVKLEAGWVLVPREPTPEMLAATVDERGTPRILDFTTPAERGEPYLMARYSYRAMVAAAPKPPVSGEAELRAALDRAAAMSGLSAGDFLSPPQPLMPGAQPREAE